jgi:hypothetical protein
VGAAVWRGVRRDKCAALRDSTSLPPRESRRREGVAGVRIDALPLSRCVAWEVGTQQGKAQKRGKAREVNDTAQRGRGSQELFGAPVSPRGKSWCVCCCAPARPGSVTVRYILWYR